ncbi:hypothetical protein PINS_up021723 [Pythium insidiosum]|nr:hypothetical protein PINS_up021723 [Pythium insidiosum]
MTASRHLRRHCLPTSRTTRHQLRPPPPTRLLPPPPALRRPALPSDALAPTPSPLHSHRPPPLPPPLLRPLPLRHSSHRCLPCQCLQDHQTSCAWCLQTRRRRAPARRLQSPSSP